MCRLFGFRSAVASSVHRPLVRESNALCLQSTAHPDGWGLGFYFGEKDLPKVFKSVATAHRDDAFAAATQMVTSNCVLAHIRKASVGRVALENTHPFQHGRILFAHNGTVENFSAMRASVEEAIAPDYRQLLTGETDSERCFYLFLTHLSRVVAPDKATVDQFAAALVETLMLMRTLAAPHHEKKPALTFLVTDGVRMAALRDGRTLNFSTHKVRCVEKSACASYPRCEEQPEDDGPVNHLIVSSEKLSTDDAWFEIPENGLVGVDASMVLRRWTVDDFSPKRRQVAA